jgi:WD40 repeat protein
MRTQILEDEEQSLDDLVKKARTDSKLKQLMQGKQVISSEGKLKMGGTYVFLRGPFCDVAIGKDNSMLVGAFEDQIMIHKKKDKLGLVLTKNFESHSLDPDKITCVSVDQLNGDLIAVGTDQNLGLFTSEFRPISAHLSEIPFSAISLGYKRELAAASGNQIFVFDTDEKKLYLRDHTIDFEKEITAIAQGPNGSKAVAFGNCLGIELQWAVCKNTRLLSGAEKIPFKEITSLSFSPDKKYLAVAGSTWNDHGFVVLYDNRVFTTLDMIGSKSIINGIAFTADSKTIYAGNEKGELVEYLVR